MILPLGDNGHNIFIVHGNGSHLIVGLRQELYHRFTVGKLMTSAPARLYDTDSMEQVMRTFDDTKAWNLPVVDGEGKYLGFVSKSKIFNSYRQVLVHFSED